MSAPYAVELTAVEAALLDGKVGEKAQAVVTRAIEALSLSSLGETQAAMVASILAVAREKGRLTFSVTNIRTCPCCKRTDGYWPVKRNTRWKVKGRPDFDNPKVIRAYNLDQGFITIQNHISVGFCETCRPTVEPVIRERLATIPCDTPAHWPGQPRRFARWDSMKCGDCGWEGHEGQMRPLRTLMGDGHYQGGCPNCPAFNGFGSSRITRTEGWVLVSLHPDEGSQHLSSVGEATNGVSRGATEPNPYPTGKG